MNYTAIGFTIVFAVLYYGAGEFEARNGARHNGILWAALSIGVSALVFAQFGGGVLMAIGFQVLLLFAIGAGRALLEKS